MEGGVPRIDWLLVAGTNLLFAVLARTRRYLHSEAAFIPGKLIGEGRVALWLYAIVMMPGTFLHELSHTVAALILLVDVRSFSVSPQKLDGGTSLGRVGHERTDVFRNTIIGLAPLIVGTTVILVISALAFDLTRVYDALMEADWHEATLAVTANLSNLWGWIMAYLVFVVSASMFPSPTDIGRWMRVVLLALPILIAGLVNLSAPLLPWLVEWTNTAFRWLLLIFAFTLAIDLPTLLLLTASSEALVKQFPSD